MNSQKCLSKEVSFVLYGGGEVGNNCYQSLKAKGYHVAAALDKNKSGEHIIEGLYTYKLGTEPKELDKQNCVVVICLANGMIHKSVADSLYRLGYIYIVFLPMNHCIPDEQKRKLTRLYNHVLFAEHELMECTITDYTQYSIPNTDMENSIIEKSSQNITVWMRLEMLFSESLELWKGDKSKIHTKAQYKDRNIACANPCEDLFDFFALRSDSCETYFSSKKEEKSKEEKERELSQRESLYRLFQKEHERGMEFFIEGAPQVMWNPDAYCNLVGGHHRTLYLLHEGHSLFPVKMQYDDFDKWYNKDIYIELEQYIFEHNVDRFYAPIPHPCFLNFPVKWEDVGRTKLADVMRFLANIDVSDMTVLDCSDDEGYFARNMDRIGAKVSVFLSECVCQIELANLLNRLLYRNNVIIKEGKLESIWGEEKDDSQYDIIFALSGIDIRKVYFKSQVELLGLLCNQYLFMETTQSEEIEYIQKCTGFKTYIGIHREYRDGQIWELGVYSR